MFTLSKSPVKNWIAKGQPECYYRGFRDDSGTFTPVHWKILALKFAFVIIFEHVVFGVCKLIDVVVPDIPESLDIKVKRERYLAKEALQDAEHVLQKVLTDREDELTSEVEHSSPVLRKRPSREASQEHQRESPRHHQTLSSTQQQSLSPAGSANIHLSNSQNHLNGAENNATSGSHLHISTSQNYP